MDVVDGRVTIVFETATFYGEVEIKFDGASGHAAHGHLSAVGATLNPVFQPGKPWNSQVCKSGKITFEADGPR